MSATFHPCRHCGLVGGLHVERGMRCADGRQYEPAGVLQQGPFDGDEGVDGRQVAIDDHRAALVRAIVAQQWAVACVVMGGAPASMTHIHAWEWVALPMAGLPCAVDVVAEVLGEKARAA